VLAGALALPFLVSNYRVFQFNMVLVYTIVLLGLTWLTGYNGQISLGHGAFYAIGAYVAAILMERFGWPYWSHCRSRERCASCPGPVRIAGSAVARTTRTRYLCAGRGYAQILKYKHIEQWTGGVQGIVIIKPDPPFGLKLTPDQWLYCSRLPF